LVVKKSDLTDTIAFPLVDGVYTTVATYTTEFAKLVNTANGFSDTEIANNAKRDTVYKKIKTYYEQSWKTMLKVTDNTTEGIKMKISPTFTLQFKKDSKLFTMQLCYAKGDQLTCYNKSGITYPEREFNTAFQGLVTLIKGSPGMGNDEESQLKFLTDIIYTHLTDWIKNGNNTGIDTKGNVTSLAYNDSLKAYLTIKNVLRIFKVKRTYKLKLKEVPKGKGAAISVGDKKSVTPTMASKITNNIKKDSLAYDTSKYEIVERRPFLFGEKHKVVKHYENNYAGTVNITNAKFQIEDGFVLSFTFDIDPTQAAKYSVTPNQTIRVGYNVRNIMFAGYFLNNAVPIYLQKEKNTFVIPKDTDDYVYKINEFVDFKTPLKAPNAHFTAQEMLISIDSGKLNKPVPVSEKSLYTFANLDVFSDLFGLFDQTNPNGLIQSEFKIGTMLFRKPLGRERRPNRSRVTILNKGEFFFRFSKLDEKTQDLSVIRVHNNYQTDTPYVHGINLFHYQSMSYGIHFNLLNLDYRGGNTALVGEASIIRTPLRDSVKTGTNTVIIKTPENFGINSTAISLGINSRVHAATFLDLDFGGRYLYVKPTLDTLKLSNSPYNEFYKNTKFVPVNSIGIVDLKGLVNIYLNDEKSKRIIIRLEYLFDVKQRGNAFPVLQVGYSANLDKFLKLSPPPQSPKL
jgi:hypothetical protein